MWNYVYFLLHLDSMHANDHNALEKYINDNVSGIHCTIVTGMVDNDLVLSLLPSVPPFAPPSVPPSLSLSLSYLYLHNIKLL